MNSQAGTCPAMNPSQEAHLCRVKEAFARDVDAKYRKGAREHGDDLLSRSTLEICDMLIEEALDQYVYAVSLREKLTEETPCPTPPKPKPTP